MKNFLTLTILTLLTFTSCKNDENWISEYDLFDRLQGGNGIWKVESYDSFDNTLAEPNHVITEPDDEFYEFYVLTKEIFTGGIVEVNAANYFVGDTLIQKDCEAEKERVVFDATLGGGEVWTVTENKRTKQVWNYVSGNNTIVMTLKKCNCELPKRNTSEVEG